MYKNRNRKVLGEYLLTNPGDSMRLAVMDGGIVLSNVAGDVLLTTHPNREIESYLVTVTIEPYFIRRDALAGKENFTESARTFLTSDDINNVIDRAIIKARQNELNQE